MLVAPSIEDGFALVVGEALACGVPVITTTATGAADIVVDGVNGYIIEPGSPDAIAACLERLFRNRGILQSLKSGAIKLQEPVVGVQKEAIETVAVYNKILH